MNKRQLGFGGLQVVLSIAAIGVLAMVAVPQYQGFISKAKMTEAFNLAGESRKKVAQFYMVSGRLPKTDGEVASMTSNALSPPEHVREMIVERDGQGGDVLIKVYLNKDVVENLTGEDQYIFIAGHETRGGKHALEWRCGSSGIQTDLLPEECRS